MTKIKTMSNGFIRKMLRGRYARTNAPVKSRKKSRKEPGMNKIIVTRSPRAIQYQSFCNSNASR